MKGFDKDGLIEITVTKRGKRKLKELALFASLAVPPVLLLTMLDVWMKHPAAAVVFLGAASAWDILFAVANKRPRKAIRGREFGNLETDKNFRVYDITSDADLAREEVAS